MNDTKPIPCPFCGGELRKNMCGSLEDTNEECILYGYEIHEKMIPKWNNRKPMEKIVERLEAVMDEAQDKISEDFIYYDGYGDGVDRAIAIVKEEGGINHENNTRNTAEP